MSETTTQTPESYLEFLKEDAAACGLWDLYIEEELKLSIRQTYTFLISSTEDLFDRGPSTPNPQRVAYPVTEYGNRLQRSCDIQQTEELTPGIDGCCMAAEPTLAFSLDNDRHNAGAPIIITHDDEPIAYIKGNGERTAFGLQDVDELHSIQGAISSVVSPYLLLPHIKNPKSRLTYKIEARQFFGMANSNENRYFRPVRLSRFLIPIAIRQQLSPAGKTTGYDMPTILDTVFELAKSAVPIEPID